MIIEQYTELEEKVKTLENLSIFSWLQGVEKKTSGMISVNSGIVPYISLNLFNRHLFYRKTFTLQTLKTVLESHKLNYMRLF